MPAQMKENVEFAHWLQEWIERMQDAGAKCQRVSDPRSKQPMPGRTSGEEERAKAG